MGEESIEQRLGLIEKLNSKKNNSALDQRNKVKEQEWFFTLSGQLPKNWIEVNFMDITWLITCGVAKKPTYTENGVPFLSAQNTRPFKTNLNKIKYISENEFKKLTIGGKPEKNDILYTRVGNCGEAAKINYDFDFAIYVSLTLIKPIHELVDTDYLVAFLNGHHGKQQTNIGAIGIGLKNLNVNNVRKFRIPLPPLSIQRQIVSKIEELFSELDKGIENLKLAQEQLKTYRQAVLKWAFEGKLTNKNVKEGELPKGWKMVKIEDIATVGTGATPLKGNKKYYEGGSIAWITSGALNDEHVTKATDFVTPLAIKETNLSLYPKNTLLLAMYGEGKTRGKCSELLIEATTNQAIAAIYFEKHDSRVKSFLKYFLLKNYIDIRRESSGGVQPNLNLGIVKKTIFPFPPISEQETIIQEIESRLSVADKMEENIKDSLQQAEALRQSILKKAFEGELVNEVIEEAYKPKNVYFYQMQVLAMIAKTSKEKEISHGEMTLAKYAYLIDKLCGVPTYYDYKRWHLGPYPVEMKKAINNKEFFKIENYNIELINETKLFKYENPLISKIQTAVYDLSDIFSKYKGKERSHKIELLATVCKVIDDLKSTDLKKVRTSMQDWKIDLKTTKFKNKAEKFNEGETKKCLEFIVAKGWDTKLLL